MNKYQETLDWFCNQAFSNCENYEEQEKILQELVDKEKHKNAHPIKNDSDIYRGYARFSCPNCNCDVVCINATSDYNAHYKYCPYCGQRTN